MKISLQWLKEWVDIPWAPEELAEKLAGLGFPVDAIQRVGVSIDGIVVAKILSVEKHPNADRLRLATVDDGKGRRLIVCGAPNIEAGQIVPLALPGTEFPNGLTIQVSKIRGVESSGMLCSARELGLSGDHSGIYLLPEKAPLGKSVKEALGQDVILDIDVTPNRPDALSHYGIAREIAALRGKPLKPYRFTPKTTSKGPGPSIKIENPQACPRYMGRVLTGVTIGPAPDWMRSRLINCGIRSINNVVDITNYVLLEFGHPLHAFDLSLLAGPEMTVRQAKKGEKIAALDEKEYSLQTDHLVIADKKGAVAIAGVMGGERTGVTEKTKDLLLETAVFDRTRIRKTSKDLGLRSESSIRFEKGVDADTCALANRRATELIVSLAGGAVGPLQDKKAKPQKGQKLTFRPSKVAEWVGTKIPTAKIKAILKGLGFGVTVAGKNLKVQAPAWRKDIEEEADLLEEVLRFVGYDSIPIHPPKPIENQLPEGTVAVSHDELAVLSRSMGLNETLTNSFTSQEWLNYFGVAKNDWVEVANPVSSEEPYLRPSLLLNLLKATKRNLNYQAHSVRLFELGRVFSRREDHDWPREEKRFAFVLSGQSGPPDWRAKTQQVDFFILKDRLETINRFLGGALTFHYGKGPDFLHPGQKFQIEFHGKIVGYAGLLGPDLLEKADLKQNVAVAEFSVEGMKKQAPVFRPFTDIPFVERDLAILVDKNQAWASIEKEVLSAGGALVRDVSLFDVFSGKGIDPNKKSVAFRVRLHDAEKTLGENEINGSIESIKSALQSKIGAQLR